MSVILFFIFCSPPVLCTQESQNIREPTIRRTGGQHVWLVEDMISDNICIPARWHDAIQGVGKQFDSAKEVRLALIYYYTTKKFVCEFVKNEKTRVTVECIHKRTNIALGGSTLHR